MPGARFVTSRCRSFRPDLTLPRRALKRHIPPRLYGVFITTEDTARARLEFVMVMKDRHELRADTRCMRSTVAHHFMTSLFASPRGGLVASPRQLGRVRPITVHLPGCSSTLRTGTASSVPSGRYVMLCQGERSSWSPVPYPGKLCHRTRASSRSLVDGPVEAVGAVRYLKVAGTPSRMRSLPSWVVALVPSAPGPWSFIVRRPGRSAPLTPRLRRGGSHRRRSAGRLHRLVLMTAGPVTIAAGDVTMRLVVHGKGGTTAHLGPRHPDSHPWSP